MYYKARMTFNIAQKNGEFQRVNKGQVIYILDFKRSEVYRAIQKRWLSAIGK